MAIIGFCFLFLIFGFWRYQQAEEKINKIKIKEFKENKVILKGQVIDEPEARGDKLKFKAQIDELGLNILVVTGLFPKIKYGDILEIKGRLKEPPVFEDFNYRDYLRKQGVYFLMTYPEVEILERNRGCFFKKLLIFLKEKLKESCQRITPADQSGFFEALLFGEENNISEEWKEKLNITGTRHIAAVSGTNITIISLLLLDFLLFLGFWRQQAFWFSLVLIPFYILMIGAPPCAVRAGIMGLLFLTAQYFGRIANPERLIVWALFLMLLINPLLLGSDIGFQLSFLAVAGLIYFGPLFFRLFKKGPKFLNHFKLNLASTLAAQFFTLPILLYNFGQFSLIAPLTNILILPAIPFLTVAGFLFSFLGIFSEKLGWFISLPAQALMILVMNIINFFSRFSLANLVFEIPGIFVFFCYFFLTVLVIYLRQKQKLDFLNYY